jgi:RND family efflux transporter MFP subunit
MKNLPRGVLPLLIIVIGVLGAVAMMKLKPSAPKRPAVPHQTIVTVHRVDGQTPTASVTGYGVVAAQRRITLVPQVSGVVVETSPAFQAGGSFVEGDVLLRIDDADYLVAAEMAEAQVARQNLALAMADQEAEIAQREWERIHADTPDSQVRPNPLVLHGPQLASARAELASAEASLAQARLNLARCVITAPFSGRVVDESVDAGQYVRSGNAVGTIYATDVAEVTVPLQDGDLAFFDAPDASGAGGAEAELVANFAGREHVWKGRVVRLSGALDPQTRLVDTVVVVDDGYVATGVRPALLDGMFVEVRLAGHSLTGMVEIPRAALREGSTVWVVDADNHLTTKSVSVARIDGDSAIVASGLRMGDDIVISQLDVVSEGMNVRIAGRPAPEPAAARAENRDDRGGAS